MKLAYSDLIKSIPALGMIGGLHLPVKASMNVAKILRQVDAANQDYEKVRLKLVDKYARKDGDGKIIEIADPTNGNQRIADFMVPKADADGKAVAPEVLEDHRPAFDAELKELQEQKVDIAGEEITVDSLGSLNLPGNVLASLFWLIVD